MSETTTTSIYAKLLEAKKNIGKAHKGSVNPHFKNKYADINALIEAVEQPLLDAGLVLLQPIENNKVVTRIIDVTSGEMIESVMELPNNGTPQQIGSCLTYYRRYTLQSLMSMQADDDDSNLAKNIQVKKPTVTNEQFNKLVVKYEAGEVNCFEKMREYGIFTSQQELEILEIVR